ncbi:MAG: DUF3240 family protein [Proteobacteria bacterium]|nr:DUF3240 family protein [Pseudomonadota bacterium]
METDLCRLTLVYPPALDDLLAGLLLALDPPLDGFTTWPAEGHGLGFDSASAAERVRGRIRRSVMTVILPRNRLPAVLHNIKATLKVPGAAYWVETVEQFERLGDAGPEAVTADAAAVA